MAVYTNIERAELERFLAGYEIGRLLSFVGIKEGVENSNFLLKTDRDRFILTIYEKRVDPADLPFFLGLKEHLAAAGFSCPVPIKAKDGQALQKLAGKPAAIISFLKGRSARRVTPIRCHSAGATLAELHIRGQGFAGKRANALSMEAWAPLFADCQNSLKAVPAAIFEEVGGSLEKLGAAWPRDLPAGIIHADYFTDNVFFDGDDVSGVIDFYFACNDLYAYDLAICLNAWCFEALGDFNVTKARAFLRGYAEHRKLSAAEIDALPILAEGAALRFLLTRLFDWLNQVEGALVKPKDPGEYLRKLRFHKQVSGPEAYGID